ncbi:MAG TPA: ATP-binding protein [Polyangiales bacterium]
MLGRAADLDRVNWLLRHFPVVALLGPRQVGKTTLARAVRAPGKLLHRFDLESSVDLARLADPLLTLEPLRGLVVLDEVQRRPDIFNTLRVLADRPKRPARYLVLGSASPELLRQTSETLAGRIAYHELSPLSLSDVGAAKWSRLWRRGGFPRSFLAASEAASVTWRQELIRTFLERDIPQLGIRIPSTTLDRFWAMLAHYHGQTWNGSELGRAFGVADTTVRVYLDLLAATFMVRVLPPWFENLKKRQVKAPKVYISDCGILHTLLGIEDAAGLERHPKVGASWEGFALAQTVASLRLTPKECYFWATHQGAELDLLVVRNGRKHGFEFKRSSAPAITPSMKIAFADLGLASLTVVHAGEDTFPLGPKIRAVALSRLLSDAKLPG